MAPELKMITLNHIKYIPTESNASPMTQKFGNVSTCTTDEDIEVLDGIT